MMTHVIISGKQGCGKTQLARKIRQIVEKTGNEAVVFDAVRIDEIHKIISQTNEYKPAVYIYTTQEDVNEQEAHKSIVINL